MNRARLGLAALTATLATVPPGTAAAGQAAGAPAVPPPPAAYRLLVGAESEDQVALIEFRPCPGAPCGARVLRTYEVGLWATEIEGPHGVVAAPDGRSFYVTLAHGRPNGWLQQYDLDTGRRLGQVELGMFPATVDLGPGGLVYVINFNFEDPDMKPSGLSVVAGDPLFEVARLTTCRMPHGSRLSPDGSRHYSGCMMDDRLVEVDTRRLAVSREFSLVPGREGPLTPGPEDRARHSAHGPAPSSGCSPTWAQPSADGRAVYVACNRANEIVEIDVGAWRITRRWTTPRAPYNLAVTPDGTLLLATQKGPGTTTVWRLADARLLAEIPGTRGLASGVAVSRDSRYAFVTLEGVGGEPGTVDVIDLVTLAKVASVDVGKQAGGIAEVPLPAPPPPPGAPPHRDR